MSGSLNKVTLIGNLGQDPEVRNMQNGKSMASLSLATTESWKDKATGEKRDKTEWHRVTIFSDGLVNVCQKYLKKGAKIYIEGQLQTRKWQDQDGKDRYSTEVVIQGYGGTLIMLDGRNNMGDNMAGQNNNFAQQGSSFGQVSGGGNAAPAPSFAQELDDDIPF